MQSTTPTLLHHLFAAPERWILCSIRIAWLTYLVTSAIPHLCSNHDHRQAMPHGETWHPNLKMKPSEQSTLRLPLFLSHYVNDRNYRGVRQVLSCSMMVTEEPLRSGFTVPFHLPYRSIPNRLLLIRPVLLLMTGSPLT